MTQKTDRRINLRVSNELYSAIDELAQRYGSTRNSLVVMLLGKQVYVELKALDMLMSPEVMNSLMDKVAFLQNGIGGQK